MSLHDIPNNITPDALRQLVHENPHLITQMQSNGDMEMVEALQAPDVAPLRMLMMKRSLANHKVIFDKREEEARIFADPLSEENQALIAERIRQQNVQASMETAMEEMPESFGSVHMLYINIEVNGTPIKAFVDSGAQSTIMSVGCAERCGVTRLIDTRWSGQARGVGTAKIVGRVHMAQMKLGQSFFPISLTVLENDDVDFLFGLDMLKRHRCAIDLRDNVLRVEGSRGIEEAPFLSEGEIPKKFPEDSVSKRSRSHSEGEPSSPNRTGVSRSGSLGDASCSDAHLVNSDVIHLCSLGFSIVEASNALSQAEGDVELAAQLLFSSRT
eukprot:CAMPEP_0185019804 /NCGR_PEP_ID=MMETSP1103-20130426/2379_1 /TAXON_ID=36769 /ORGANISM="Paraphysomonas bandaiensis, Strain Caron Lab Isolate" /LENGTH=327 /DNA_ID=CAMNT_0027550291 /DNA_START=286 /DNA_END=1269 /DNA_ORIENTATION=-